MSTRPQHRLVGKTAASTRYHLLTDEGTRSLCGRVNERNASAIAETLSQTEANQRGLSLCGRCLQIHSP